jgi:Icc protein
MDRTYERDLRGDMTVRTLVHLSDTHVVPEGQLLYGKIDALANLRAALAMVEAASLQPTAIVITGDLTDTGEPDAYDRFRRVVEPAAERIGAPVVYVMGNHDERGAFRSSLLGAEATTEPVDHVVHAGDLRIIAMDSSIPGRIHGRLEPEQLDWLREELATPAPAGTVLAMHHPPLADERPIAEAMLLHGPERLAEVVAGSDVRAVLAGHTHSPGAGVLAGIPVWVAGAIAYTIDYTVVDHGGDGTSPGASSVGVLRGVYGSTFSRVDLSDHGAVATSVPVALTPAEAIAEAPVEQMLEWVRNDTDLRALG